MSGTGGWQVQAANQPAAAVAGNRASSNPMASFSAGPGGLVAGAGGVVVGRFAWAYPPDDPNGGYTQALNTSLAPGGLPTVVPAGLVPNDVQASNSTFLSFAGMTILAGYQMYLVTQGDWWVVNDGTIVPIPNYHKAFADVATGKIKFAAPGAIFGGASATASSIAASTFSVTGSIADDVLTVTAVGSGSIYPGSTISGTGIATGTKVVSQLTGTANGVGIYLVDIGQQTVASTTVSGTYGTLTIGTATGTFAVGDVLTGTNVVAGTQITANLTGTGGTGGTMVVSNNTVVSSTTITASTAVETKWVATSSGPAGAIVKISSWQP